eukprot:2515222-Pleurochrysis_carterae.AAC.4
MTDEIIAKTWPRERHLAKLRLVVLKPALTCDSAMHFCATLHGRQGLVSKLTEVTILFEWPSWDDDFLCDLATASINTVADIRL